MDQHIRAISTSKAPQAIGPYSQGIEQGDFVFVSGQLGFVPETGEFAGSDFASQALQALRNVRAVLQAGGAELTDVVTVDVFVTDLSYFGTFNEIYADFFRSHKPARAVVEVAGLPKTGLVEIKVMAIKKRESV